MPRNRLDAFLRIDDLLDFAVLPQGLDSGHGLPMSQHFNCRLQGWVFLPDDLLEFRGSHAGILQLLERAACFDALMLTGVADQKDPVTATHPLEKFTHLIGTRETRFVDEKEPLMLHLGLRVSRSSKKALQCSRMNTHLFQLFCSTRGWCETLYLITFGLSRTADDFQCGGFTSARDPLNALNAVSRTEYVLNDRLLSGVQMGTLVHGDDGILA